MYRILYVTSSSVQDPVHRAAYFILNGGVPSCGAVMVGDDEDADPAAIDDRKTLVTGAVCAGEQIGRAAAVRRGQTCIVSIRMKVAGTYGGAAFCAEPRDTRVWRLGESAHWQVVAGHSSAVQQ